MLKLPPKRELKKSKKTLCMYVEVEQSFLGDALINEKILVSKSWVKDLAKVKKRVKPKKQIKVRKTGSM